MVTVPPIQVVAAAIVASLSYLALHIFTLKPFDLWPVIGHLWHFGLRDRHSMVVWVLNAQKRLKGKTWFLSIPGIIPKAWMVHDPACIKYITLNKHQTFNKEGYFKDCSGDIFAGKLETFSACCGSIDGRIINATGKEWQVQHQAAHVFVTPDLLHTLSNVTLPRYLRILVDELDKAADSGEVIDLSKAITHFIFAVFGDIAWDVSWDELKPLSGVYDQVLEAISWRYGIPGWRMWERLFPYGARLRSNLAIIRGSANALVQSMKAKMRAEELGETDIQADKGMFIRSLLKEDLSDELMIDACITFANAGRGAASQAVTWGLYELMSHPKYIDILRRATDKSPSLSIQEMVKNEPVIDHIVSEIVRLNPSIPFEVQQLQPGHGNVVLPDGTVVEPGTIMFWCVWAINRNPEVFGEDAEEFRPERWAEMDKKPSAYEMPTFNAGPRSCPGQQMARLELAYVFKEVFGRYDLEKAWEGGRTLDEGVGGEMRGGLPVKVKRRVE